MAMLIVVWGDYIILHLSMLYKTVNVKLYLYSSDYMINIFLSYFFI